MPPRVTPASVAVHGVGVEVNGPQIEEERMCGPEGGHTAVNATILQI